MNLLILTYWSYKDALVQSYTLPYVRIIRNQNPNNKIFLVTIEQPFHKMSDEEWLVESDRLKKENIELIRFQYDHFGVKMAFRIIGFIPKLVKLITQQDVKAIHSWCMTAGALGYLLSILTSKPLIIDSYEPHAESMVENGTWKKASFKFKLLFWLEKKQSKKAKTVIALTKEMSTYAKTKYDAIFDNYYVKPALVDLEKFSWKVESYNQARKDNDLENKVVCIYAGKLGGIYLEEEVFDFFKVASNYWGEKLKIYLLTDKNINDVNQLIKSKKIPDNCIETKFISHKEIPYYFQLADFAINPVKPVPSKRYCTSIKDGEYWSMGLPVVITQNISDDSEIIEEENIGFVLRDLNNEEYLNACKKMDTLVKMDNIELRQKITAVANKYRNFTIAENIYKEIYQ